MSSVQKHFNEIVYSILSLHLTLPFHPLWAVMKPGCGAEECVFLPCGISGADPACCAAALCWCSLVLRPTGSSPLLCSGWPVELSARGGHRDERPPPPPHPVYPCWSLGNSRHENVRQHSSTCHISHVTRVNLMQCIATELKVGGFSPVKSRICVKSFLWSISNRVNTTAIAIAKITPGIIRLWFCAQTLQPPRVFCMLDTAQLIKNAFSVCSSQVAATTAEWWWQHV